MKAFTLKTRLIVLISLCALLINIVAYMYYPADVSRNQKVQLVHMLDKWLQQIVDQSNTAQATPRELHDLFLDKLRWNPDFKFLYMGSGDSTWIWPERYRRNQENLTFEQGKMVLLEDETILPVVHEYFTAGRPGIKIILGWSAQQILIQKIQARKRMLQLALISLFFVYGIILIYNFIVNKPLKRIINHTWLLSRGQLLVDPSAGGTSAEFVALSEYLSILSNRILSLQKQNEELPKRLDEAVKQANVAQTVLDRELKIMSALVFLSIQFRKETTRESILQRLTKDITEQIGYQISLLFVHENHYFRFYSSSVKGLMVLNTKLKQDLKNYIISSESPEYLEMHGGAPYITSQPHFQKILENNNIETRLAMVPIVIENQLIGMLCAGNLGDDQKLDDQDLEKLTLLCNIVALNIQNLESIINLHRNVQQRTEELETTNKLLAESILERDNVLKLVSHDLNAPLRNVVGLVDSIERKYGETLPEDVLNRIQRIRNNVEKERQMIKDVLLSFRAIESNMGTEDVDINEILLSIKDELQLEFERKSIDLVIPEQLPVVRAQRHLVKHIFLNLIDNAVKYLPENTDGNLIKIDAKENVEEITYSVADNGLGIPQEKQLDIFHSYTSFQKFRELEFTGLGLGLALVKNIIEKMSGKIWVKSKPGEGTTFFISFRKAKFQRAANN